VSVCPLQVVGLVVANHRDGGESLVVVATLEALIINDILS